MRILLCFSLVFISLSSNAQNSNRFIVWDENLNIIENILSADSATVFFDFENNSPHRSLVYLVYYGSAIQSPEAFIFPYENPLGIIRFVSIDGKSFEPSLNSFFHYNDTIESLYEIDTSLINKCFRNRDSLPEGHWYRYIKNDTLLYLESKKTIKNNLYHGIREFVVLNNFRSQFVDSAGYVLTSTIYDFKTNQLIGKETYNCNVLIEDKRFFFNGKLSFYSYYNWGSISIYDSGGIFFISQLKNQVKHGYTYMFTEEGQICAIQNYYLGILIETNELINCIKDLMYDE